MERVGPVAYRLQLPDGSRIHNVFQVSLLREYVAGEKLQTATLPTDFRGTNPIILPVSILDSRVVWRTGQAEDQFLIRWADSSSTPSWEPAAGIRQRFPNLPLEDKEALNGGGLIRVLPTRQ